MEIITVNLITNKQQEIQKFLRKYFQDETYTVEDKTFRWTGIYSSALKALDLGDNSFAALITRGLAEITRLGQKMGGEKETFYGLTGLGDLIVTCESEHSRNRKAGFLIGQGKTLEETKQEVGMTIESIDNIEVAHILAQKYDIEMPIVETVYEVLHNNLAPREAVNILMTRKLKTEKE